VTQHLDDGVLHALLDGEIPAAELSATETHLQSCAACLTRLEEARAFRDEAERLVGAIELPLPLEGGAAAAPTAATLPRRPRRVHLRPLAYAATLIVALGLGYGMRGWVSVPEVSSRPSAGTLAAAPVAPSESSLADLVKAPAETPAPRTGQDQPRRTSAPAPRSADAGRVLTGNVEAAPAREKTADARTDSAAGEPQAPAAPAPSLERSRPAEARQAVSGERRFVGTVTDQAGRGIAGASVMIQGTALQARTGPDGGYRLEGDMPDSSRISARAIGYRASAKTVSVPDSGTLRVDFALPADAFHLEEVVVSGAGRGAVSALRTPIVLRTEPPAFHAVDFPEALRRLGGRIKLVDGLVPVRLEALGDTVRLAYRAGRGREVVWLQQCGGGDTVAFALIPPPGFPADSLARLTARVKP
jgi:hypothetical protein